MPPVASNSEEYEFDLPPNAVDKSGQISVLFIRDKIFNR